MQEGRDAPPRDQLPSGVSYSPVGHESSVNESTIPMYITKKIFFEVQLMYNVICCTCATFWFIVF